MERAALARLRILVAEDNLVNQKVVLRLLERLGYRADVVANGLEALDAVSRHTYDIVLMDMMMPQMDGIEATRAICHQWALGDRPRIIATTANAMAGDRERCLAAGMDDYLSKPVRLEALREALARTAAPILALAAPIVAGPALDASVLAGLRALQEDGGTDLLAELVELFLSDSKPALGHLRLAIGRGDAEATAQIAHRLKGSSANLGASGMAELCAELEHEGRARALQQAPDLLQRLESEFARVCAALAPMRG